jgi:alpha-D-ribose 1-methylphosphonate 5-triphosphate synthase subunit PhnG
MSTVDAYCQDAANGWHQVRDKAAAELAALPDQHLDEAEFDRQRFALEKRVEAADGMVRWYLSDAGRAFVAGHSR